MLRETLTALLQPVVAGLGYELWELEYLPGRGNALLRVYIDTEAHEGITVDDCERASRAVSEVLDAQKRLDEVYAAYADPDADFDALLAEMGTLQEAILAIKLDRQQDKDQILSNYLNTIYFGRDSYGIETAARSYFGVGVAELNVSQAALLAGVVPSSLQSTASHSSRSSSVRSA